MRDTVMPDVTVLAFAADCNAVAGAPDWVPSTPKIITITATTARESAGLITGATLDEPPM
jgi:hypothetical protein